MTEDQEHVYAIAHEHGFVKIGRSKNPQQRLSNHQTSCPYNLWLLASLPVSDSRAVETDLHEMLDEKQVRGEWFELEYDDYDDIVDMMKMAASSTEFESVEGFREWQARKNRRLFE